MIETAKVLTLGSMSISTNTPPLRATMIPDDLAKLRLLSAYVAAEVWGVGHGTVRRWAAEGRIAARRLGGRVLIPASEVRRVAEEGLVVDDRREARVTIPSSNHSE